VSATVSGWPSPTDSDEKMYRLPIHTPEIKKPAKSRAFLAT